MVQSDCSKARSEWQGNTPLKLWECTVSIYNSQILFARVLVRSEEESAVFQYRTSKRETLLCPMEIRLLRLKRIAGVQALVAIKHEIASVKVISAGLGHHANSRPECPALVGAESGSRNVELLNTLDGEVLQEPAVNNVGVLRAIDGEVRTATIRTAGRKIEDASLDRIEVGRG